MKLNTLKPGEGSVSNRKRVGRGIGSGWGKTCARGHKGQKSRSGGFHKVGFEGGQMPLQRRLPKVGFTSRVGRVSAEIRLHELASVEADVIDLDSLKEANLINKSILNVKVMLSGELNKPVTLKGIKVSKGALKAIEAAGGKVED
ncbi:50S ribosomal protein L15 [Cocleimonas flava]|uniref:Large ribosomal subunit protein uL15 n=1 Tax=Cocleimonas flava TaxID=634765 RepID=A0A4R1ENE3_9GAMM|nr:MULTISPECIES: 50S ribosomal protein L15 [Cocleimonas]MEB8433300.1 50S ribosomal protein L15 [Cocleimonas sp. KMM 6892]MEC4717465.1 50S ribosomal protein L15 [Cocleimonas sp. KMM 6895]MEC4745180.1 50S ribosomal protein L15 [Cocleimonas sp. KMM 6896]TCJ82767.1 LSU ribosomal protein L15P [Cocleimonas flava]